MLESLIGNMARKLRVRSYGKAHAEYEQKNKGSSSHYE